MGLSLDARIRKKEWGRNGRGIAAKVKVVESNKKVMGKGFWNFKVDLS